MIFIFIGYRCWSGIHCVPFCCISFAHLSTVGHPLHAHACQSRHWNPVHLGDDLAYHPHGRLLQAAAQRPPSSHAARCHLHLLLPSGPNHHHSGKSISRSVNQSINLFISGRYVRSSTDGHICPILRPSGRWSVRTDSSQLDLWSVLKLRASNRIIWCPFRRG